MAPPTGEEETTLKDQDMGGAPFLMECELLESGVELVYGLTFGFEV